MGYITARPAFAPLQTPGRVMDGEIYHKKLEIAPLHSGKTMSCFFFSPWCLLLFIFFTQTLHNVKKVNSFRGVRFHSPCGCGRRGNSSTRGWRIFGGSRIPRSVSPRALAEKSRLVLGFWARLPAAVGELSAPQRLPKGRECQGKATLHFHVEALTERLFPLDFGVTESHMKSLAP